MTPEELDKHIESAKAIANLAYDCVEKKFNDEALLHLGMLGVVLERVKPAADENRADAERYRWLRDRGSLTWIPFQSQWRERAEGCDRLIDAERARQAASPSA